MFKELERRNYIIKVACIIKMTDLLKEKGIEFGKVYTDKDRPPFK